jgi:hypothetical protein
MSTTWNAARVPHLPDRTTRTPRISPSLSVLGRLLVFLAWAALMAWAILVRAAPASAQDAPDAAGLVVQGGDRVRVLSPALGTERVEARVIALRGDTLVLSGALGPGGRAETALVPISSVHTLDVSRGTASNAWKGAKIGAGIGAALGLVVGIAAMAEDTSCQPGEWCLDVDIGAEAIPVGMLGFGLFGGLVGTGIGALSRSERWESVPVARLRVEPRAGGAAIVASVPLRF